MDLPGVITLDGQPIGSFELDEHERATFKFNKGAAGVQETLELAAENGMTFGLSLAPKFPEEENTQELADPAWRGGPMK